MRGPAFIGRFMQHVLPSGLKRIRQYGLLANPNGKKLALAQAALHMPAPNPMARASAQDFMARVAKVNTSKCPACEHGRLRVVFTRLGHKRLPDPMALGMRVQTRTGSKSERHRPKGHEHDKHPHQPANAQMARSKDQGWLWPKVGQKLAGNDRTASPPAKQRGAVAATKARQREKSTQ